MVVWQEFQFKNDDDVDDIDNDADLIFLPSEIQLLNSSSLLCADFLALPVPSLACLTAIQKTYQSHL